jgi:regulatory protein
MAHKVTALTPQKRNRQRVNVYLDGEFAFGLQRIVAAWLQVGQEISAEKIAQLQADDALEVAYQQAIRLLSYRPRTQHEIRQNLSQHGFAEESIDAVVNRLLKSGLVDDLRFAQSWVENRSEMRPRSQRALAYELKRRGVDRQIIEQSLASIDEEALAYQAALKKTDKFVNLDWNDFRQKLYRYLSQRGFNFEVISQVTARLWAERLDGNLPTDGEEDT